MKAETILTLLMGLFMLYGLALGYATRLIVESLP